MYRRIPIGTEELVESTSGNAGYAAAYYAKQIGMPIRIFMPEGMSPKKVQKLIDLNAEVIQTPRPEYTGGARKRAQAFYLEKPNARWFFNQASNTGNIESHRELAPLLSDVDDLVLIGGTCGAIAGLGQGIKEAHDAIITEIDLDSAPHFYNKKHGKPEEWKDHGIVGAAPSRLSSIGEEFFSIIDRTAIVKSEECEALFKEALNCGLDTGKSSIVNLAVAARIAAASQKLVGTGTYDHIDRYEEINLEQLSALKFSADNLIKFFRSEIAQTFRIHLEDLHGDAIYQA